jgi:SAM-dependent methyltransferase
MTTAAIRTRWEDHYASGHTPWDTQLTPPEVQSFWHSGRLPPTGLALDVGCGPGTNVLYLARQGLTALGFDIAYAAVAEGRTRIAQRAPDLLPRAHLIQADVTALPLAAAGAAYILDLGCSHGLPPELRDRYAAGITANLRPGGYYHLYAFDYVPHPEPDATATTAEAAESAAKATAESAAKATAETTAATAADRHMGMRDDEVIARFTPTLEVVEILRANPDRYPCRWYLLRKP